MFCQIRISDVLRLIKFQFYGRFRPYEQFVSRDLFLFLRTIHLEIPYGCTGIRTDVFGSCFCDNLRWQRWRVRRSFRVEPVRRELSSPQSMMMYWTYLMRPRLIKNGKSDADWHFVGGNIKHNRNIRQDVH